MSRVCVINVHGGKVVGLDDRTVRVEEGDVVELHWRMDAPTKVHLHGYDVMADPGVDPVMRFEATTAGRFPVETHGDDHGHCHQRIGPSDRAEL